MAIIKNPTLFSKFFGLDSADLFQLGAFDPILNVDTPLFIDPILLQHSTHDQFAQSANERVTQFFRGVIKLLHASQKIDDLAWRNAKRIMAFHEIKGTCLGYGSQSISGSAFGPALQAQIMNTAKQIIDIGVDDPQLFFLLALLEEGVGADRISDMLTNILIEDLVRFSERINAHFGNLPVAKFSFPFGEGSLVRNPIHSSEPIILVPSDILASLPVANSWNDISRVCSINTQLRKRINEEIGKIWFKTLNKSRTAENRQEIKDYLLDEPIRFQTLLDCMQHLQAKSYDFTADPDGVWKWLLAGQKVVEENPVAIEPPKNNSIEELERIVKAIIVQFKKLVEENGLWKEFWLGNKSRGEKAAQRLFFAVADSYCKANNIDISPESDSGNGPVDFKFSSAYDRRCLVEIKLSSNSKIISGLTKQLETYKKSESTILAFYLVIEIGHWLARRKQLYDVLNVARTKGERLSTVMEIDAKRQTSASKR